MRTYLAIHAFEDISRSVLRRSQYLAHRDRVLGAVLMLAWGAAGAGAGMSGDTRDWPAHIDVATGIAGMLARSTSAGRDRLLALAPVLLLASAVSLKHTARRHRRTCTCPPVSPCAGKDAAAQARYLRQLAATGPATWDLPSPVGLGVFDAELRDLMHAEA